MEAAFTSSLCSGLYYLRATTQHDGLQGAMLDGLHRGPVFSVQPANAHADPHLLPV